MKVFISHSFADKKLARQVADTLRASGFQVWDDSQVLPGDNWGEELGHALQDADAMVVLLTANTFQAPNVGFEVSYALGQKRFKGRVVPVLATSSEQLPRDKIPWVLNKFPMINLAEIGSEEAIRRITQVLHDAA